jgi:peptide deformylase
MTGWKMPLSNSNAYMKLIPSDDPILRKICRADFVITHIDIVRMLEIMCAHNALGLAAPQVGIDARLFVTNWGEVFVNPILARKETPCIVGESCLSLPGLEVQMNRYHRITLADGRVYTAGRAAVIQHELDHLNGVLISDYQ